MKARIGLIGCGWWATRAHLPALRANPDAIIAGIADPNPENRKRAADSFEVPPERVFESAEAMFEGVALDAAIVAAPHSVHAELARAALQRRLHLLLEKPMTINPADARSLASLSRLQGVELIIGYPWHYNRQVLAVRNAIAEGQIGTIEYVSCQFASIVRELYRGNPEPYRDIFDYAVNAPDHRTYADPEIAGGGQGQTQVTHSAALLFLLTGLRPTSVAALTESFELEVDLADAVVIRFAGGAIGSLGSTGSVLPGQEEILEYRIFGNKGHIVFDVNDGAAAIYGANGEITQLAAPPAEERYPDWAPADNLVEVALGRGVNGSPASLGVLTVEFVAAMYQAAKEGKTVRLGGSGQHEH